MRNLDLNSSRCQNLSILAKRVFQNVEIVHVYLPYFLCSNHELWIHKTNCPVLHWHVSVAVCCFKHEDVIKWKHVPRYWPFVRGIHMSLVNSPHKGQWRGALMFSLICTWINGWVNNFGAVDLRRHRAHYDVTVMNPLHPLPGVLRWFHESRFSSAKFGPIKNTGFLKEFLFWSNQTGSLMVRISF